VRTQLLKFAVRLVEQSSSIYVSSFRPAYPPKEKRRSSRLSFFVFVDLFRYE